MFKEISERTKNFVTDLLSDVAIKGVIVSDNEGNPIYSSFSTEISSEFIQDSSRMAPVASTVVSVSASSMRKLFNQKLENVICFVDDIVFLIVPGQAANIMAYIDREIVTLRGVEYYKEKLYVLIRDISAMMETSGIEESVVVKVKRVIPEAIAIGIVTNEGLPLAFQTIIDDAALAAASNGIYILASAISGESEVDYIAVQADQASLILHRMDEGKILVTAVPKEQNLGEYIVKIKQAIAS